MITDAERLFFLPSAVERAVDGPAGYRGVCDEDWKIYIFTSDNQNGMLEPRPITCLSRTLGENDFILGKKNVLIAIAISISVAAGGEKAVDGGGD